VNKIKRPIILFFDGHQTHISARIVKAAMDNQIELECLPPHTTTVLQPLDVVTLHKIKTAWRSLLVEHNIKTNSSPIDKQRFALLVSLLFVLSSIYTQESPTKFNPSLPRSVGRAT
jgi:hypothetical protein